MTDRLIERIVRDPCIDGIYCCRHAASGHWHLRVDVIGDLEIAAREFYAETFEAVCRKAINELSIEETRS